MSFLNDVPLNDLRYLLAVLFIILGSVSIYYREYLKAILDKYFKKKQTNFDDYFCSKCVVKELVDKKLLEIKKIIEDNPELKLKLNKLITNITNLRMKEIKVIEENIKNLFCQIGKHDETFRDQISKILDTLKEIVDGIKEYSQDLKVETEDIDENIRKIKNDIDIIKDVLAEIKRTLKENSDSIHNIDTIQTIGKGDLERILSKVEKTNDILIELGTRLELLTKKDVAF